MQFRLMKDNLELSLMGVNSMDELAILASGNNVESMINSDPEFEKALDHICENVVNKDFYYRNAYMRTYNPNITENYENKNLRRSFYVDSNFNGNNLKGVGFTDSIFNNTNFNNCQLDNSNFEANYIFNCNFNGETPCIHVGFSKSFIYQTTFKGLDFLRCRLSDVFLHDSHIENCSFDNTSFDGTIFDNTILDNVKFKNLNLEYTQFRNIQINNSALPFPTIPFIINGITYLKNTDDKVFIKSMKKGKLSKDEYLDLLPDFKIYYERTKNYFPLANIYISEKNIKETFECIKKGIKQSIFLNSYRQLKYFCILANVCDLLDIHQRKDLLAIITKEFNSRISENFSFYSSITQHYYELNNILLSSNSSSLIVSFNTNIDNNNYNTISEFYKTIDMLVSIVGVKSNYSINFTYNSQADIIATINSIDTTIIVALISAFTTLLISGIKGIAHLPKVIADFATIKTKIENEKQDAIYKKLSNYDKYLDILKKEKELEMVSENSAQCFDNLIQNIEPVLTSCDKLNEAGVVINNISFNTMNVEAENLTEYTNNIIYKS